jgi:hypothetical protein
MAKQRITVEVNDVLKRKAYTAINAMAREANKKGGYVDLVAKLAAMEDGKEGKLASYIYSLGIEACQLGRASQEHRLAWFAAICRSAEAQFKEKEGVDNVKDRCPCWPVFKSEIKRGLENGLDCKNYEVYTAFKEGRKAIEKQRAERGARAEGNENRQDGEAAADIEAATTGGNATRVTAKLSSVVKVMSGLIPQMDADAQDAFAEELSVLCAKYAPQSGQGEEGPEAGEEIDEQAAQSA